MSTPVQHRWEVCEVCGPMVVCGYCGNNCCNGGSGENCPDRCASAYEKQKRERPARKSAVPELSTTVLVSGTPDSCRKGETPGSYICGGDGNLSDESKAELREFTEYLKDKAARIREGRALTTYQEWRKAR